MLNRLFTLGTICLFAGAAGLAATNAWVVLKSEPQLVSGEPTEVRDFAIVLGAGVRGEALSGALKSRMMRAIELYERRIVKKILVSGDGTDSFYNETAAMKKFAYKNQVAEGDVVADSLGFSTYDSVSRARSVFEIRNAYIVSQPFHLHRALWLANALGIDARGVSAGSVDDEVFYAVREVPARSKDLILHLFKVTPAVNRDRLF